MNTDTTALKTLAVLYGWFCDRSGFPTTIVSDNGPQFLSHEFASKMSKWGIKHILTPPYHPASNGLAEKAVGIVKGKLKKMGSSSHPIELYVNLQAVLRGYRASPHTSTCQTPYELISSAPVPLLFPKLQLSHKQLQENQRTSVPKERFHNVRSYQPGDSVLVYDTQKKINSSGVVKECKSRNSYIVTVNDREKHISGDHITFISKGCSNVNESERTLNSILDSNKDSNNSGSYSNENLAFSDNESNVSDESDISMPQINISMPRISSSSSALVSDNIVGSVSKKKYKTEHLKLRDGLSTNFPASRTRSGKI